MNIYDPFQDFTFDTRTCFLSGEALEQGATFIPVVPEWIMEQYGLAERPIQMLDERVATYQQLQLPCSPQVAARIHQMDEAVRQAFTEGYDKTAFLDPQLLFQWIAKLVYGMIYNEIQAGVRQQAMVGEPLNFSQVLVHKFKNLHLMLQSLILPVQFDGLTPFSLKVVRVDNPSDTFSYRDEINTLVFSMRMKDFGIIACLQDNGTNAIYHHEYLEKLGDRTLHPIQFEELCARYFYSGYLFNRLPEYSVMNTPERVYLEPMSLGDARMKPFFDAWQVKTFGQVLENFWKPWGYTLFEIIKNPEQPMTFLLDAEGEWQNAAAIDLPLTGNSDAAPVGNV